MNNFMESLVFEAYTGGTKIFHILSGSTFLDQGHKKVLECWDHCGLSSMELSVSELWRYVCVSDGYDTTRNPCQEAVDLAMPSGIDER